MDDQQSSTIHHHSLHLSPTKTKGGRVQLGALSSPIQKKHSSTTLCSPLILEPAALSNKKGPRINQLQLLQERIKDLWEELKIPLADRRSARNRLFNTQDGHNNYNNDHDDGDNDDGKRFNAQRSAVTRKGKNKQDNASQALMLELVTLLRHRQSTIAVMKSIRDREQCLGYLIAMFGFLHTKEGQAAVLSLSGAVNLDAETHRENFVRCLALIRDLSLVLLEAIKVWRKQLWRPRPFYWTPQEGGRAAASLPINYVAKMSSDVAVHLQSEVGQALLTRLGLKISDFGLLVPKAVTRKGKRSEHLEQRSEEARASITQRYLHMLLAHNFEGISDRNFASEELLKRQDSAIRMLLDEPRIEKEVHDEAHQLQTQGCFIPLLRPLPVEQLQNSDSTHSPSRTSMTTSKQTKTEVVLLGHASINVSAHQGAIAYQDAIPTPSDVDCSEFESDEDSTTGHVPEHVALGSVHDQLETCLTQVEVDKVIPVCSSPLKDSVSAAILGSRTSGMDSRPQSNCKKKLKKIGRLQSPVNLTRDGSRAAVPVISRIKLPNKTSSGTGKDPAGHHRTKEKRSHSSQIVPQPKLTKAAHLRKSRATKPDTVPSYARPRSASVAAELWKKALEQVPTTKVNKAAELRKKHAEEKASASVPEPVMSAAASREWMEKALNEDHIPKDNKSSELRKEVLEARQLSAAIVPTPLTAAESAEWMHKALNEGNEIKENRAYELRKNAASVRRASDTVSEASAPPSATSSYSAKSVSNSVVTSSKSKNMPPDTAIEAPVSPLSTVSQASDGTAGYSAESFEDEQSTALSTRSKASDKSKRSFTGSNKPHKGISVKMSASVRELCGDSLFNIPTSPTHDYGSAVFEISPNASMVDVTNKPLPVSSESSSQQAFRQKGLRRAQGGGRRPSEEEDEEEDDVVTVQELTQLGVTSPVNGRKKHSVKSNQPSPQPPIPRLSAPPTQMLTSGRLSTIYSNSSNEVTSRETDDDTPVENSSRTDLSHSLQTLPRQIVVLDNSVSKKGSSTVPIASGSSSHDAYMASVAEKLATFRRPPEASQASKAEIDSILDDILKK